ncbi:MAG: response regulator [Bdellovibrionota bacterium]
MLKKQNGILSIADALKILTPKTQVEAHLINLKDQRRLLELVAKNIGFSELELLKQIGSYANYPVLSQVEPLSSETGAHLLNLEDFERVGAIPIMSQGLVVGVCCVDPIKLRQVLNKYPKLYVSIAPWAKIHQALLQSKENIKESKSTAIRDYQTRLESAAKTTLKLMLTEAHELGADKLELKLAEDENVYKFITQDKKNARGTINSKISPALNKLLKENLKLEIPIDSKANPVTVKVLATSNRFVLSFLDKAEVTQLNSKKLKAQQDVDDYVLLVDDNLIFSNILERFLNSEGYKTLVALDGEQAFKVLSQSKRLPSLIICDLHMPNLNGEELVAKLKAIDRFCEIKILMLTSDDHIDTELSILSKGVEAFLSKSEEPASIALKVIELLNTNRTNEAA